jgi:RNA polymerase sigma factor (sigma-70 family)
MSDAELLARFVSRQEASAFEELVRRHGPMVMRVCQRVLAHAQDAEDAFQAAFIVLARKASGIAKQGSVGSWLYGVAYRVALQVKENTSKHRLPVQGIDGRTIPDARQTPATVDGETRAILDQELNRLPEKYRAPLVLCYLEGKTTDEAARELGWPTGTVAGRLPRARDLLRDRLTRRGLAVSGVVLATLATEKSASAAVPAALLSSTVKAATGAGVAKAAVGALAVSPAASLADAAIKAMFWAKMKLYGLIAAAVAVVAVPAYVVLRPSDHGLVGHYALAEGSGATVNDASASGNHGTLMNGGVTWTTGLKPGSKALSFDGKNGYIKVSKDLNQWLGGTASLAFWIKTTQPGGDEDWKSPMVTGSIAKGPPDDNDINWGVLMRNGRCGISVGNGKKGDTVLTDIPIHDGVWHHLALTRDQETGQMQVFLDGRLAAKGGTQKGIKTTPFVMIGRCDHPGQGSQYFQGSLSDLRIYKRVLKSEEIESLAKGS